MKVWSSNALWNSVAISTTTFIGILAFWDGMDESGFPEGVVGFLLAIVAPALCWGMAWLRHTRGKVSSASRSGALIVTFIGMVAYSYYATNGRSDPDTAAHMHVVLFPIIYVIFAIIILLPLLLFDVLRTKRFKNADSS